MAQKETRAAKMVKERARARRVSRRASMEERKAMEKDKDLGSTARAKAESLEIAGSVARQGIWLKIV